MHKGTKRSLYILQISSHFYPKVDGTVKSIDALIQGLRERGHLICLITRRIPGTPFIEERQGVKIIRVGPSRKSMLSRLLLGVNQALTAIKCLRHERVDVIDTHGFSSMVAGLLLKEIYHAPLVLTFHGFPRLWAGDFRWRRWREQFFSYPLERLLIRKADKIIVRSALFTKMVTSVYGTDIKEKIEVIPHEVDTGLFWYDPPRVTDTPVVLFVGTLSRVHGAELLIKAAPIILKELPKTRFIIVGGGPLRPQLEKLTYDLNINNSVIFTGLVGDSEKLAQYYRESSVVVIPLRYKGYILSLVAVEALATGRPVVTTMQLDPNLIDVGIFPVEEYAPNGLAKAVLQVLSDRGRLKNLALSARRFVEEFHSKEVYLSRIEEVYTKLINIDAK